MGTKLIGNQSLIRNQIPINAKSRKIKKIKLGLINFFVISECCGKLNINKTRCNCTYEPCPRKGICCECLHHHLNNNELPACCFPNDIEKTYDRSIRCFLGMYQSENDNL